MTVGMREVKEKRKRWREHKSEKKRAELLGKHMIPVVLGPNERYYVVDHHHLARALHDEGVKDILVTVHRRSLDGPARCVLGRDGQQAVGLSLRRQGRTPAFWGSSEIGRLELKDDPFRSLAGELRRAGGFAKDTTPFSEFLWADFLRRKISRKSVEENFDKAMEKALGFARSKDAVYLPGWCGPID